jgi:hypothetical protein
VSDSVLTDAATPATSFPTAVIRSDVVKPF